MSTVDQLREALGELPVTDADLRRIGELVNKVEQENTIGAAAVSAMESMRRLVDQTCFKRGEVCPVCHHKDKHTETCYLRAATGWDLLEEHEATLRENDELRAALAKYLPHNGRMIRSGGRYRSLKQRATMRGADRNPPPSK